jgi:exosortase family protein XrtF
LLKKSQLKSLFFQYKPFFTFLLKFLLFYVVFTFIYKSYLNTYNPSMNEVDGISKLVANQTKDLLVFFGHDAAIQPHPTEPSIKIFYKEKYVSRIVEGCNAISVMILFAAFIFAFSNRFLKTFLFILIGLFLIYLLNIVRIALLSYALYYYPAYEELLHGTIFPLFIYGIVFLLWIVWVTQFSGYDKKAN